jgi:hypothetical protein
MSSNVIDFLSRSDEQKAKNLVFAIGLLDQHLKVFNTASSDLINIAKEFLKLKKVSTESLASYIGHTFSEVKSWLSGEKTPPEPIRTIVILGIDVHVKEEYRIPLHT